MGNSFNALRTIKQMNKDADEILKQMRKERGYGVEKLFCNDKAFHYKLGNVVACETSKDGKTRVLVLRTNKIQILNNDELKKV